jgi:CheY-like chemotaxis protein
MMNRLLGETIETDEIRQNTVVVTQHTLAEEAKHSVRILLAEDNILNQKLAVHMLTKGGYQLEIANNGREAVELFTAHPEKYDLIFMDIHMPEIDGLEATTILRQRGFSQIPIVAMTADAMKEDEEKCLKAGMNDYIAKPIKREMVFKLIEKWVFPSD